LHIFATSKHTHIMKKQFKLVVSPEDFRAMSSSSICKMLREDETLHILDDGKGRRIEKLISK
jgi:hypothetical protein